MGRLSLLLLAGCLAGDPVNRSFADVKLEPPTIESLDVVCDADRGRWTLTIDATAWTGGATTAWTSDGTYVELHDFSTESYADDGSYEVLVMTLSIVEDWREAAASSTVFLCTEEPSLVLSLRGTDGEQADCATWGPNPELLAALEDVPQCP